MVRRAPNCLSLISDSLAAEPPLRRPAGAAGAAPGPGPRGRAPRVARWPSLVPPDPARQKRVYMQVMLSSHHTTNAHFSRSTHDLMMISWIAHPRYPAQVTASQQRAALLLHDAEVGDDGPDDEKDEEQAS